MIKCETFGNGNMKLEVKGSLENVTTDSANIIATIYRLIYEEDKMQAYAFKKIFLVVAHKMFDDIDKL